MTLSGKSRDSGPLYLGHGTWQRRQGSGPEATAEAGRGAAPAEAEGAARSSDFAANALDIFCPVSPSQRNHQPLMITVMMLLVVSDVASNSQ